MTDRSRNATYVAACVVTCIVCVASDGIRGLTGGGIASLLCAVPLAFISIRRRVAARGWVARLPTRQGWIVFPEGMLMRMGFVLGGSVAIYLCAGQKLGLSYWLAVLVLYEVVVVLAAWPTMRFGKGRDAAGHPA